MHIWTETPLTEIWQQLRYFESSANVENLLSGKTKSNRAPFVAYAAEIKQRARRISACIKQSYEYFLASQSVSLSTRPLLLYYQFLALAKAVILADDNLDSGWWEKREGHGLTTTAKRNQHRVSVALNPRMLPRMYVHTHKGIFEYLYQCICGTSIGYHKTFYLKDLFRIMPDMADIFARYYKKPSSCYRISDNHRDHNGHQIVYVKFQNQQDIKTLYAAFPNFATNFTFDSKTGGGTKFIARNSTIDVNNYDIETGALFGDYLVKPLATGMYRTAPAIYAAMYILSDIVRYKPDFWTRILEGHTEGSSALVSIFCHIAQRRFTNDILEKLWLERFTYGTPGYLT